MRARQVRWSPYCYQVFSESFAVKITGGSVTISDLKTKEILARHSKHKYLYTGDIHPDESVCIALEYGKHFYVYSLRDFALLKRVTLPRGYDSIDLDCRFSEDGRFFFVRAKRWIPIQGTGEGPLDFVMLVYRTNDYSLAESMPLGDPEEFLWKDFLMS